VAQVVVHAERRAEQAGLGPRRAQVAGADGTYGRARPFEGIGALADLRQLPLHRGRDLRLGVQRDGAEQGVPVGEVPVGGVGATPAARVAARRTTASGPPARASSTPASSSARRRSPWW
jgi:hypothetical protein